MSEPLDPEEEDVETEDEMIDVALDLLERAEESKVWAMELARLCASFWQTCVQEGVPKGLAADMAETWLTNAMSEGEE